MGPDGTTKEYDTWYLLTFDTIYAKADYIWVSLTILNTLVSIYAIFKIFATAKKLSNTNMLTSVNKQAMMIHGTVITIQSVTITFNALANRFLPDDFYADTIATACCDTLVQLAINYICLTMGSSA